MNRARWGRVQELFEQVRTLPLERRAAFLDEACGDDAELRAEVTSLVDHHESEPDFLDRIARDLWSDAEEEKGGGGGNLPLASGSTVSHYRIEEGLGRGGMGIVYRARDLRLDRTVALKFLTVDADADSTVEARFLTEARAASALDHPHVGTVHEIDRDERGRLFIAMALYEGGTIGDRIAEGPLAVSDAVTFGIQLAQGLGAAHERGIIHRDIKPSNLMIGPDGLLKIIDFGVAKLAEGSGLTRTGSAIGTAAYMSPEQIQGAHVDERTDVWSVGVVLYEMLAGRRPFGGADGFALAHAILEHDPPALGEFRADAPEALGRIVARCLARDRAARYRSVKRLVDDLERVAEGRGLPWDAASAEAGRTQLAEPSQGSAPLSAPYRPTGRGRALTALALLVVVVVAGVVALDVLGGGASGEIDSLAVLPLANLSGDAADDYLVQGVHDALVTDLSRIGALRVISRTSVLHFEGSDRTLPEIAEALSVDGIVQGSVLRVGDDIRIAVQLIDGSSDEHVWAGEYDRALGDALGLIREVAATVADEVQVALSDTERARLTRPRATPAAAEAAFLNGSYFMTQFTPEATQRAIEFFEEALAVDSTFAEAWAALSRVHIMAAYLGLLPAREALATVEATAARALALDPDVVHAHTSEAWLKLFRGDPEGAADSFELALDANPNDVDALHGYGDALTFLGRGEEGLAYVRRARASDPYSPIYTVPVAVHLFMLGRHAEAVTEARAVLAENPGWPIEGWLARFQWQAGNHDEAARWWREAWADRPDLSSTLDGALADSGPIGAARAVAMALEARADSMGASGLSVARWWALAGEPEQSVAWIERAADEGRGNLVYAALYPEFDIVLEDPVLQERLRLAGVPVRE